MKKILFAAAAVLAVSLVLVSCSREAEEGFLVAESESCDFSFEYPAAWKSTYTDGMLAVMNPDDVSGANVTAQSFRHGYDEEVSSEVYWEEYKAQFEGTFSTMNVTKNIETTLSGVIARHVFYTVDLGQDSFNCQTVLCVFGDKTYVLTLTQGIKTEENAEYYNDHSEEFEEIVKSFRIGS